MKQAEGAPKGRVAEFVDDAHVAELLDDFSNVRTLRGLWLSGAADSQ